MREENIDLLIFFGPWVFGLIFAIVYGFYATHKDELYHSKMNTVCAPSFFVEEERAADHLTRVKCLSEQGEKKEILIKDDVK